MAISNVCVLKVQTFSRIKVVSPGAFRQQLLEELGPDSAREVFALMPEEAPAPSTTPAGASGLPDQATLTAEADGFGSIAPAAAPGHKPDPKAAPASTNASHGADTNHQSRRAAPFAPQKGAVFSSG